MSLSPNEIGTPDHPARSLVRTLSTVLLYYSSVTVSEQTPLFGRRVRAAQLWKLHVTDADIVG